MSLETVKWLMKSRLWINNLCLLMGPMAAGELDDFPRVAI